MSKAENDNAGGKGTQNPELAQRSVTQIFESCVSEKQTPTLWKLLDSRDGSALRQELMCMIRQFVPHRSPRDKVKVVGKLVRNVAGATVESPVIIRDLSGSGAQIAISTHLGLSATDLANIRLRLRIPDQEDTIVRAQLARVISTDANFIQAGFKFQDLPDHVGKAIHTVQHAQSIRASEIANQRLSKIPKTQATRTDVKLPARRPSLGPRLK